MGKTRPTPPNRARRTAVLLALALLTAVGAAAADEVRWFAADDFAMVALIPDDDAREVRLSAIIAAGEVDNDGVEGAPHLLEHFVYRHAFGDEASHGGDQHAAALATSTVFSVSVPADRVTWALEAMRRTLEVPAIGEAAMGAETARVRDEIAARDRGLVPLGAMRAMRALVLPAPYDRPVLGDADAMDAAAADAALTFHQRYYRPDRAALVVHGALSRDDLAALPGLRETGKPDRPLSPPPPFAVRSDALSDPVQLAPEGLVGRHAALLGTAEIPRTVGAAERLVLLDALDLLLRVVINQDFGSADGRAHGTARNFTGFAEPVSDSRVLFGLMAEAERGIALGDLERQLRASLGRSLDAMTDRATLADLAAALQTDLLDGPRGAGETSRALIERSLAGRSAPVTRGDYRDALDWLRSKPGARAAGSLRDAAGPVAARLEPP